MTSYLEQFRTILATGQPWRGFSPLVHWRLGGGKNPVRWLDAALAARRAFPEAQVKLFVRAVEVHDVRGAAYFEPATTTTAIQAGYIGTIDGQVPVFTDAFEPPERQFIRRSAVVVADFVAPEGV